MSSNIGLLHEIHESLRTLYRLVSIAELDDSRPQNRRRSSSAAGKLDEGSLIVLCIAIPLVCIFFLLWLLRERILGKDDDPVDVFRHASPPIQGPASRPSSRSVSESGPRQPVASMPHSQRDLGAHEHSHTRPTSSEEVRQLC
jgi:hypothetical protein